MATILGLFRATAFFAIMGTVLCGMHPVHAATTRAELAQEFLRQERSLGVTPQLTLAVALQSPDPLYSRYLCAVGPLVDVWAREPADGLGISSRLTVSVEARRAEFDAQGVPDVLVGERICLLIHIPPSRSRDAQPAVIAWAPESTLADVAATPDQQADAQTRMGPGEVVGPPAATGEPSGPRGFATAQANPFERPLIFGMPVASAADYYNNTVAQPIYQPAPGEQVQFISYVNLAKHWNPKLSDPDAKTITQAIFRHCAEFNVSRLLVASLIYAESRFNPQAKSPAGALGLCQLMPGTAAGLGVTYPYDISQNVYGGVKYLAQQLGKFAAYPNTQRFEYSMAAYNAGPNAVARYGGVPPYAETQRYVRKVAETFNTLWANGYR